MGLLGVFQKLIASKSNDHEGFYLLGSMVEHFEPWVNTGIYKLYTIGKLLKKKFQILAVSRLFFFYAENPLGMILKSSAPSEIFETTRGCQCHFVNSQLIGLVPIMNINWVEMHVAIWLHMERYIV